MHPETFHGNLIARRTIAAWQECGQALDARLRRENKRRGYLYLRAVARLTALALAAVGIIASVYLLAFLLLIIGGA